MADIQWVGIKELRAAINRNPQVALEQGRIFLTRGLATYKSGILNNPWRVGGTGGGAPVSNDPRYPRRYQRVRSGNLRDSHMTEINGLEGRIGPSLVLAPYARYVHEGTRRMAGRPWLEYVKSAKQSDIESHARVMLQNIVGDLAR